MRSIVAVAAALVAVALVVTPQPAAADDTQKAAGPDIAGRWVDKRKGNLTLDVSRCGNAWCGVVVDDHGECGFRALQITLGHPNIPEPGGDNPKRHATYEGEFRYGPKSQRYVVRASVALHGTGHANDMWVGGNPEGSPEYTRMMPLNLRLVREGDGRCPAERPGS